MKQFGKILLIALVFLIWFLFVKTYYLCAVRNLCVKPGQALTEQEINTLPKNFNVLADSIVVIENFPQFIFKFGDKSFQKNNLHKKLLEKIANLLKSQPKSKLLINGFYLEKEKEMDENPNGNLGLDRANSLGQILCKEFAVSAEQIISFGALEKGDSLAIPITVELLGFIPPAEKLQNREEEKFRLQWKDSLNFVSYNGLLGLFESANKELKVAKALEDYTIALKKWLKNNPEFRIKVIGHSDSHLSAEEAMKTSLLYAQLCEKYLKSKGIRNKIETSSVGKAQLKTVDKLPDKSPDLLSIAKNRRVDFVLYKVKNKKRNK